MINRLTKERFQLKVLFYEISNILDINRKLKYFNVLRKTNFYDAFELICILKLNNEVEL